MRPSPYRPFTLNRFHYGWHYFWETGPSEVGNIGTHSLDICRWGMDNCPHPAAVDETNTNASFPQAAYTPGPSVDPATEPHVSHFGNFIAAVRSRRVEDHRDIAEGHLSTTLAQLATISYRLGRKLVFNLDTETFSGAAEANQLLTRTYRKPYVLPDKV